MPEEKQITLKEFLDKVLKLNDEEWKDMTKESRERILHLIDPDNLVMTEGKSGKGTLSEAEKSIINFVNMPAEEVGEMKPWKRNLLLKQATELAQARGKMV